MGFMRTPESFCQSMLSEDQYFGWHNVTAVISPCSQHASPLILQHARDRIPHSHIIWWDYTILLFGDSCWPNVSGTVPLNRFGRSISMWAFHFFFYIYNIIYIFFNILAFTAEYNAIKLTPRLTEPGSVSSGTQFDVLCIHRSSSGYLGSNKNLSELLLLSY